MKKIMFCSVLLSLALPLIASAADLIYTPIANKPEISSVRASDTIIVLYGSSVRRIRVDDLLTSMAAVPGWPNKIGTSTLETTATTGFIGLPAMAGQPTGTPTGYGNHVPAVVDTSDGSFWVYVNSAWTQISGGSGDGGSSFDTNRLSLYALITDTIVRTSLQVDGLQTNYGKIVQHHVPEPGVLGNRGEWVVEAQGQRLYDAYAGTDVWKVDQGAHIVRGNFTLAAGNFYGNGSGLTALPATASVAPGYGLTCATGLVSGVTVYTVRGGPTASNAIPVSLAYNGTNVLVDASLGTHYRLALTNAFMLQSPTNSQDGQRLTLELIQDATGNRTVVLDSAYKLGSDVPVVVLTTNANKRDFLTAVCNGTNWYVVGFIRGF